MRHRLIRWACSLAVGGGGSLRHLARLFAALFLLPLPQSSIQRWSDDIGSPVPRQEEMLQPWLAITPATACHIAGDSPRGTAPGGMGGQEAPERLLMTHAAGSANGADARKGLQKLPGLGRHVPAACADDAQRCTEAIPAV
jgi:hypothetical protein